MIKEIEDRREIRLHFFSGHYKISALSKVYIDSRPKIKVSPSFSSSSSFTA